MKTAHFLSSDDKTSQDLAISELDYSFTVGRKRKLEMVTFKFSQAVSETVTITLDSAHGVNYDVALAEVVLVAETSFVFRPQGECNLQSGDQLRLQCTNANGIGVCYANIKTSEL